LQDISGTLKTRSFKTSLSRWRAHQTPNDLPGSIALKSMGKLEVATVRYRFSEFPMLHR
jgi:hypothetical protein